MRRKSWQKILSLALCLMLIGTLAPAALAEEPVPEKVLVTSIALSQSSVTMTVGDAGVQVTATVSPENADNPAVTWASGNTSVATVDNGFIKPVSAGTCSVTCTAADGSGVSASVSVTVNEPAPIKVESITLSQTSVILVAGGAGTQVTATVLPENAENRGVTWASDNTGVATVEGGLIKPVAAGTCSVTCTAADGSGVSAKVSVTVEEPAPIKVESITLSQTAVTLTAGGAGTQVTAVVLPENAENRGVTWASSNEGVATVKDGFINPVAAGMCNITCTAADGSGISASVAVTVEKPKVMVSKITLNKSALTMNVGDAAVQLTAVVSPENADNRNVVWSSSNPAVATVENGLVKAVGGGICNITCAAVDGSNVNASIPVTVIQPVTGISVSPAVMALGINEMRQLTVTISPDTASNKGVTYTSSNTAVAAVSNEGHVTGSAVGTAIITVTSVADKTKTATCVVNVGVPVTSVSVSPSAMELNTGVTQQLSATVMPNNATIKTVSWSTSDASVATVDASGVVKTWKAGTTVITATAADGSGKAASCTITVKGNPVDKPTDPVTPTEIPVQSISLSPASVTVTVQGTYQLKPVIFPDNATNKNVTYSSSNTAVAAVTNNGLITGIANGTAVITVTSVSDKTKVATCTVNVGVPVTSVSFGMTAVSIETGKTLSVPVAITPDNATNKTLIWSSSNTDVATVSQSGVVTAWKAGTTVITAISVDGSNKSASCTVTVTGTAVPKPTPTTPPTPTPTPTITPTPGPQAPAGQAAYVYTEKGGLNMRKSPSQGSKRLLIIPQNASFTVVTYGKTWCYAWYDGTYGYVMTKFLRLYSDGTTPAPTATPTPPPEAPKGQTAFVYTEKGGLNMRKSASMNAARLLVIPEDGSFTVVTYGKTWCYAWYNGTYGYVMTKFLRLAGETDMPSESDRPTVAPPAAGGDARVTTVTGGLNLRTGAGTGYARIAIIPQNAYVKVNTRGVTWCNVTYGSKTGFVMTKFLTFTTAVPIVPTPTTPPPATGGTYAQVTTVTGGLNLRKGASLNYARILIIPQNAYVQVLTNGIEWCRVSYNGYTGYVMTKYLRMV